MTDARFRKVLLLIVLGALAFRVGYVLLAKFDEPTKGDQVYYNITANQVARGLGFTDPRDGSEIAQHPPLTTLVLVPASWVNEQFDEGGEHLLSQRLTMAVIGAGVVVLIALVGRRVGGNRAGLLAVGLAALYPSLWMNDGLVMSETLAAAGVALAILLAYRFGREPTWLNAAWLGGAIGLAMLARAELGLLLPCMVLPFALFARAESVGRRLALVAVSGLAALVVLSPWLIFNLTRFEQPSLLSTNDGLTLCGANNHDSWYGNGTGLWVIRLDERTGKVSGSNAGCNVPPGTLTEAGIDASQLSNNLRADAFDFIGDHLDRLPVVVAARVARVELLRPRLHGRVEHRRRPRVVGVVDRCRHVLGPPAVHRRGRGGAAEPEGAGDATGGAVRGGHPHRGVDLRPGALPHPRRDQHRRALGGRGRPPDRPPPSRDRRGEGRTIAGRERRGGPGRAATGASFVTAPETQPDVVVIGAGPAGLTAAYMLTKRGVAPTVLEADNVVGGISKTAVRDGWRFDIGGHRFFTKVKAVDDLWFEILGKDDFLRRPRMSRIYYRKKFYDYPIVAKNALDEPRTDRGGALHGVVRLGARQAAEGQDHARGLRRVALRLAALRALLQNPEREGVGRALQRDPGRLGRAAHQGPLDLARGARRAHAEAGEGAGAPRASRSPASSTSSITPSTGRG